MPYDYSAQSKLQYNPNGLDTEGLVRTSAGDFWLCDEYSPSIVHVDQIGKVLKRYIPEGLTLDGVDYPLAPVLPRIYTRAKSIAASKVTISTTKKRSTSSCKVHCPTPTRKRVMPRAIHAYSSSTSRAKSPPLNTSTASTPSKIPRPKSGLGPDEMKLSAVAPVNATTLLIVERTDSVAKLYSVDINKATNILGSQWDNATTTPSLEALEDPAPSGITPLPKTLVADSRNCRESLTRLRVWRC